MYTVYKKTLFKYTLQYIIIGVLSCGACIVLIPYQENIMMWFNLTDESSWIPLLTLSIVFIIMLFFYILAPLFTFLKTNSNQKIEKLFEKCVFSENAAVQDFERSEPMGKISFGEKCSYYKHNGIINTIPYENVIWVYVRIVTQTVTQVKGPSNVPVERLSKREKYTLVLKTIDDKTYQIPVYNKKYLPDYEKQFFYTPGILVGFTKENKMEYKEKVKEYKKIASLKK